MNFLKTVVKNIGIMLLITLALIVGAAILLFPVFLIIKFVTSTFLATVSLIVYLAIVLGVCVSLDEI